MGVHPIILREQLWSAIYHNDGDRIRELIEQGADLNRRGPRGDTLLQLAATHSKPEIVQLLLEAGAEANVPECELKISPLLDAIAERNAKSAELLIAAGADVHFADPETGTTPLLEAVRTKKIRLVKRLIALGANVNATDHEGKTPLALARRYPASSEPWTGRETSRERKSICSTPAVFSWKSREPPGLWYCLTGRLSPTCNGMPDLSRDRSAHVPSRITSTTCAPSWSIAFTKMANRWSISPTGPAN